MTAAFPFIPLSLHPSCTLVIHVLISRASRNPTLIDRIYLWSVLCSLEVTLLFGPPSPAFLFVSYSWDFELDTPTYCLSVLKQTNVLGQGSRPNIRIWALVPIGIFFLYFCIFFFFWWLKWVFKFYTILFFFREKFYTIFEYVFWRAYQLFG